MTTTWKKGIFAASALMLMASGLAACSGNNESGGNANGNKNAASTEQSNATNNTAANTTEEAKPESAYKDKYDPAVTISTVWGVDPALKFKNGESIENNVSTKWALDTLGIKIDSLWSVTDTNNAFATKLRLSMSSGQDLPDVVTVGDSQLAQDLIETGAFRDVGELFDQYANEKWKTAMNLDSNVWNPYIRDGKKMGIPVLDYAYNHDYLLWIRQDWLDKLNLQAPKTLDDLEKIMDAFKNQNPDGLKPDKVVPLSIGFKSTMNTWMGDPSWIFGAYGTIPAQWNQAADGSLEWGSVNPASKQALQKLKQWRDKGYIPSEAAIWDENKTAEPAVAGTAGIIPGPYWMSGWPLLDTAKNVPSAVWKPYALPTGPDGKAGRHGTNFTSGVTLINKDMEHPEAIFTYQNYLFDHLADPQTGSDWDLGVFKGYDYDLDANNNPLYLDKIPGGEVNINRYWLVKDGARIPDAQMKALLKLADGSEASTKLEKEVKNNYGPETPAAAKVLLSQPDISFKDLFTGPATQTMQSKLDYLKKIELQTFNEIIYGKKGLDSFDQFVADWKSAGGDKMTQEVNDWYKSTK
ncbi:extracellular solute-binding protein [Paenibacillus sp. CF384]|uniref:extracellular solute-binding protein n=1 Tax=Paenibacillus sp. CF384 TaxID=1884382 RepID=UPI00089669C6|nr:extracellular solute-binding protein [Paenibacillus sp. CF384]SDX08441.1 carbohydrate ABC transporter substrate-binding protein, CUT1 family [Paenibacillus sp. CF384]